jgi:NDP-sugar pyrophosphorylase family protein
MYVVFMVAGMSSRYGGSLKQLAKVGLNGETLIEVSVMQALAAPFTKIIFITNELTEHEFINIFGDEYKGIPVNYIRQEWDQGKRDRPWGTTSAICSLKGSVKEPFILVNSDDLYGKETFRKGFELMRKSRNNVIGGCLLEKTMPADEDTLVNRGVIEVNDASGLVKTIEERLKISAKANPELLSKLASVNFIGLKPETLDYLQALLEDFQIEHKGDRKIEALLPTDLNYLIQNNLISMNYFKIENPIYGITYPGDEKHMKLVISLYGM